MPIESGWIAECCAVWFPVQPVFRLCCHMSQSNKYRNIRTLRLDSVPTKTVTDYTADDDDDPREEKEDEQSAHPDLA